MTLQFLKTTTAVFPGYTSHPFSPQSNHHLNIAGLKAHLQENVLFSVWLQKKYMFLLKIDGAIGFV